LKPQPASTKSPRGSFFFRSVHVFSSRDYHENHARRRRRGCLRPGCGAAVAAAATGADARFRSIYTEERQWRLARHIEDDDESHGISPDLPHVDAESQADRLAYWQNVMKQLDGVLPGDLSAPERLNYAVYRAQIAVLAEAQRFREYEQPVNADSAFWSDFAYTAHRTFATVADYRNFLSQLGALPVLFSEEVANMRAALARGFTPPKMTLKGRDASLVSVAQAKTPQEEYVPRSRETLAAESLPDGKAYYQSKIGEFTTTSYQAWRAARLVVDTGIHAQGWTRARAQAYLHDNTALADHEIETEVDRYISWPGQALSYYLGEMAILEARRKSEAALGTKFELRAFHDTVLQLGSVPLPVLAERVDAFIAAGGKSPYPDVK
jgi:uncharacterized protein (DUF885 family)